MTLDLFIIISFHKRYERMQTTGTALRAETASADDRQLPVICLHPPCNSR